MKRANGSGRGRGKPPEYPQTAHREFVRPDEALAPDYGDDRALDGIPELAEETPTALIKIHAVFTVQHVIAELRYQFEMGTLTRGDREMIAQLGKEIAEEMKQEKF